MQNTWLKCGKIPQTGERLSGCIISPGFLAAAVEEDGLFSDEPVGLSHLLQYKVHPVLDTAICRDLYTT